MGLTFVFGIGVPAHPEAVAQLPGFIRFIFNDAVTATCIVAIIANVLFPMKDAASAGTASAGAGRTRPRPRWGRCPPCRGLSGADTVTMVQCAMFVSGLTTFIQLYPLRLGSRYQVGARLPIVMGTSFTFPPAK